MNAFNRSVRQARDQKDFALAARIDAERRMIRALVKECLSLGYAISVFDGEGDPVKASISLKEIMDGLFNVDEETILIHRIGDIRTIGMWQLIYGNDGYDVIADHSDNEICRDIWDRVLSPLSEKIQAGK